MAVDDFDTSHNRECEYCHRKGFDEGDWLFMGWDDEAELYICPECQSNFVPNDDDMLVRQPEQSNDAETGIPEACEHNWVTALTRVPSYQCSKCGYRTLLP